MPNQDYPLTELSVAVAPVRERHRELIDAAVARLSERERCVEPDHLALLCAGADECSLFSEVTPTRWTRVGVHDMVCCDIPDWCSMERTLRPETIGESLWHWLDFLHATGRLDPRSDPVAELHKPLACYAGLDQDGLPLPPGAARQIECECYLPYRETVELLNEIARHCEYSGEQPLDVLRRAAGRAPAPRWTPVGGDGADLFGELGPDDAWPFDLEAGWYD